MRKIGVRAGIPVRRYACVRRRPAPEAGIRPHLMGFYGRIIEPSRRRVVPQL